MDIYAREQSDLRSHGQGGGSSEGGDVLPKLNVFREGQAFHVPLFVEVLDFIGGISEELRERIGELGQSNRQPCVLLYEPGMEVVILLLSLLQGARDDGALAPEEAIEEACLLLNGNHDAVDIAQLAALHASEDVVDKGGHE